MQLNWVYGYLTVNGVRMLARVIGYESKYLHKYEIYNSFGEIAVMEYSGKNVQWVFVSHSFEVHSKILTVMQDAGRIEMISYKVKSHIEKQGEKVNCDGPIPDFITEDLGFAISIWECRMKNGKCGVGHSVWCHRILQVVTYNNQPDAVDTIYMGLVNPNELDGDG